MKIGKLSIIIVISGILLISSGTACFAQDSVTQELTLQQAVDRALELSNSLKMAEMTKEKASKHREEAQDAVSYTPIGMVNDAIMVAYAGLLKAELNYQMANKDILSLQDDIKSEVVEKYCAVLSAQSANSAARQALKKAEWQYAAAMAQLRVGMLAPAAQVSAEAALEQAKSLLSQSEQALEKAYVELNALIGFIPETRSRLVTDIPYEKLQMDSITAEVNRAISNNADVWKALQNVILERQDLRFSSSPELGIDSYDIEKLEIEIAELTAAEAEDQLETALLLLYHDIVSLEGAIQAAEQGVAATQQALETTTLRFEVGMATQGDVISAGSDLDTARNKLAELKYSHATALSAYRNLTGREVLPAIAESGDTVL